MALTLASLGWPASAGADAERVRAELRAQLPQSATVPPTVAGDAATQAVLARGHDIWTRRFANGRNLAGCFPNGGIRLATAHPRFDQELGRVVTLETAINQCLKAHREPLLDPADAQTMGAVTAYARYLAAGQRLSVRVPSAEAEAAFESGRMFFFRRQGNNNYACSHCHVQHAGKFFGESEVPSATRLAATWPSMKEGGAATLQMQARHCLESRMAAMAPAADSPTLANLDYFLSYLASGSAITPASSGP